MSLHAGIFVPLHLEKQKTKEQSVFMDTNNIQLTTEQASYFAQPAEVSNWAYAIEKRIGPWLKSKGNKALWDVVLFFSQYQGVIKKPLSREKFAGLLVSLCPKALDSSDTISSIKASMEKSAFSKNQMKDFERLPDTHALRLLVCEIEELYFSKEDNNTTTIESTTTLKSRLTAYLKSTLDEQTVRMPCSVLVEHPVYGNITPTLSIETFQTMRFMEAKTPSHIIAYECVDGTVDRDKIYSLVGQYNRMQGVKLWVVSTSGFRNDVVSAASANFVGLMRIDLNTGVNADSFILPRSIEDHARRQKGIEMMMGNRCMEYPLLSWKGEIVTSSMAEILAADGVRVKEGLLLKSPYISNVEIEELAEDVLEDMPRWAQTPVDLELIMRKYMLEWQWGYLPSGQLGIFSFKDGQITLSNTLWGDRYRMRFTLAHEIGHFMLHSDLFERNLLSSFGETDKTLANRIPVSGDELGWLEHHANHFAACILMPRERVIDKYKELWDEYLCDIYCGWPEPLVWDKYDDDVMRRNLRLLHELSEEFKVSVEAMKWRLKSLGWLKM